MWERGLIVMSDTNSVEWNKFMPDSVCTACYYCQRYDLLSGTEYWCNIYDEKPYGNKTATCLNNDHKFFEERTKYMTAIPIRFSESYETHAEWQTYSNEEDSGFVHCSKCHAEFRIDDLKRVGDDKGFVNYCPACGTRMI